MKAEAARDSRSTRELGPAQPIYLWGVLAQGLVQSGDALTPRCAAPRQVPCVPSVGDTLPGGSEDRELQREQW